VTFIPQQIHISWKTPDIFNSQSPLIQNGLKNLIKMNGDWTIKFYVDAEVDGYLKQNLDIREYTLIENCSIVEKLDIWRLYKLYTEGGLYIDLDRLYNIPLSKIITEKTKWVLPIQNDFDFSHDFMLSAPYNPVYKEAIELYWQRRSMGYTNVYLLGAQTYMHAITKCLTGNIIDTNPGKEVFDELRKLLHSLPFVVTYTENAPFDTIVFRKTDDILFDHEMEKRKLYAEFNLKHWSGEW